MKTASASFVQFPVEDTLSYKVLVNKAVPRGDVTVTAALEILINTRDNGNDLDGRIRAALNDFIPVDWELLGHERSGATPGYERIKLKALAKVPAEQNRNLEERARQANREGLEFGTIAVKRSLPQDQVNQIIKELWFEAMTKINEHLAEFDLVSARTWRIGNVVLGIPDGGHRVRSSKGGYSEDQEDSLGQLLESGLAGVEKISLVADVTLKSRCPVAVEK